VRVGHRVERRPDGRIGVAGGGRVDRDLDRAGRGVALDLDGDSAGSTHRGQIAVRTGAQNGVESMPAHARMIAEPGTALR
jgi:hypothetical protein